ncbi:unnamed protein product [Pleuronectes platessa]|uniref:Uncharacterized protein n=1 Tax=Pleuronectes platessa TaxID=8262 RepID=A0A9N7V1W0_PLEPL|nr:unnamed protein product [Pleuronectes platessa]
MSNHRQAAHSHLSPGVGCGTGRSRHGARISSALLPLAGVNAAPVRALPVPGAVPSPDGHWCHWCLTALGILDQPCLVLTCTWALQHENPLMCFSSSSICCSSASSTLHLLLHLHPTCSPVTL